MAVMADDVLVGRAGPQALALAVCLLAFGTWFRRPSARVCMHTAT